MKQLNTMRHALSMLELVFTIVILGIVSSIGAEVIANTYESYIVQRAQYRSTMKTELALNQIANRLRYAIPSTVGIRATPTSSFSRIIETNSENDNVLQWVAYDGDSFEAISSDSNRKPGWSGFIDIYDASTSSSSLVSRGSNLGLASTVIGNLGGSLGSAVIYFEDGTSYAVSSGSDETITLSSSIPSGSSIFERYKLAWSSYALSVESGDLYLYYNFTPTVGATLGSTKSLLLKNVTNFRFKGSEGSIRIKICKEEQIGMSSTDTIHACKEKVIF